MDMCNEVNPNCILLNHCSSICEEVKTLIEDKYIELTPEHITDKLFKKELCPVCNRNDFYLSGTYNTKKIFVKNIKIHCSYCGCLYIYQTRISNDELIVEPFDYKINHSSPTGIGIANMSRVISYIENIKLEYKMYKKEKLINESRRNNIIYTGNP